MTKWLFYLIHNFLQNYTIQHHNFLQNYAISIWIASDTVSLCDFNNLSADNGRVQGLAVTPYPFGVSGAALTIPPMSLEGSNNHSSIISWKKFKEEIYHLSIPKVGLKRGHPSPVWSIRSAGRSTWQKDGCMENWGQSESTPLENQQRISSLPVSLLALTCLPLLGGIIFIP